MNVIGHDHVSANGNIELELGMLRKLNEGKMNLLAGKKSDSVMRVECD